MNAVLIMAHAPLAQALRQGVMHVFPDAAPDVAAVDVDPDASPEQTLALAQAVLGQWPGRNVLVLSDVFGATPCNVAQRLVDGVHTRLLAGVNLPMLLRAVGYRHEPLDAMLARALAGGTQGIMAVTVTAPQNQHQRTPHDQDPNDHHQ